MNLLQLIATQAQREAEACQDLGEIELLRSKYRRLLREWWKLFVEAK